MRLTVALAQAAAVGLGVALAIPETFAQQVHTVDTTQWSTPENPGLWHLMGAMALVAVFLFLFFSSPVIRKCEGKD